MSVCAVPGRRERATELALLRSVRRVCACLEAEVARFARLATAFARLPWRNDGLPSLPGLSQRLPGLPVRERPATLCEFRIQIILRGHPAGAARSPVI